MSHATPAPPGEPLHIRPAWQRVAARLQSVARTNGHAIITLRVVVNADGNPVVWPEPTVVKLEPKPKGACDAVGELLSLLTQTP